MPASRSQRCGSCTTAPPAAQGPINMSRATSGRAAKPLPSARARVHQQGPAKGRKLMNRTLIMLAAGALAGLAIPAQAADLALTRLDCGTPQAPTAVNQRFSDTY